MMLQSTAEPVDARRDVALRYRVMVRLGALSLLMLSLANGMANHGTFDYAGSPYVRIAGKLSSIVGMAAGDIEITGLEHHDPDQLLKLIGVSAGGSLIRFNAGQAKATLESQNWIAAATVQRKFPNQLDISISERTPFAIWQQNNRHFVIDREGKAMSGLDAMELKSLPLVTGEGANLAAAEIVNLIVVNSALNSKLAAAARVGDRRWTLYFDNGVRVLLPEQGLEEALVYVEKMQVEHGLLDKGVSEIDLRVSGEMRIAVAEVREDKKQQQN
jgi:cell division protein FtsQ